MSIGERITELRNERNISQAQLARLLNVSRQAVSKWENDLTAPDTLNLIRISDVLDTDVEYLATGKHSLRYAPAQVVTVDRVVEKLVEKPIYIEKIVEIEKPVEIILEKPIIKKVFRTRYLRNPLEYFLIGIISFLAGIGIGLLL